MPPFIHPTYYGGDASQTYPLQPTQSVDITLTPVGASDEQRHITLYANRPVTVGRSSKSETKNLLPSEQNALFDCPVVSRKHAELEFRPTPWDAPHTQLLLTDKHSMHGTTVNGQKLQKDLPFEVKTGDTIKFGDKVARADDTHEGITVSLRILNSSNFASKRPSQVTAKPTSGFQVPSESEYDSDDAESDYSHADQTSSAHTTPEQAKTSVGSQKSPIDLDSDKPTDCLREIIDLDPPASAQRAWPPLRPRPSSIPKVVPDSLDPFVVNPLPSLSGQPVNAAFHPRTSQPTANSGAEEMLHNTGLTGILQAGRRDESENADVIDEINEFYNDLSEDEDMDDDEDEDDDDQLSASDASDLADDASVSQHSDEGPEEQSSKRQISPELGTLGQVTTKATAISAPIKAPYDPVRASQPQPEPSSSHFNVIPPPPKSSHPYDPYSSTMMDFWGGAADYDNSSRWDVGPNGMSAAAAATIPANNAFTGPYYTGCSQPTHPFGYYTATPPQPTYPPISASRASDAGDKAFKQLLDTVKAKEPTAETSKPTSKMSIMDLVEDRKNEIEQRLAPQLTASTSSNNKRKADEISADEPAPVVPAEPATATEQKKTDTTPSTTPRHVVLRVGKPARPVKKARFNHVATEVGKYAVGMALGGVGTIAFLCSPLAERLLA